MVNRRVTRVILNTTEITDSLVKPNSTAVAMALLTTDALYVGFHGKFASRYIQVNTANTTASVLTVQYWNGSAFTAVDDLLDQTSSGGKTFAQSGFISWQNKLDWAISTQTGIDTDVSLYWIKLTVSADLLAGTKIASILNIFSDDVLMSVYAPELISDTNYLPSGKTNFLDQHVAAKDLIVLRLKQRHVIDDESQIIEPNQVSIAATYAAAWLILNPIATSDDTKELASRMHSEFEDEIGRVTIAVDINKDGQLSAGERLQQESIFIRRR